MRPATYDLDLYRGDSYAWVFRLWTDADATVPVDLTGVTAKAEIRTGPAGEIFAPMTCAVTLPNEVEVTLPAIAWGVNAQASGAWDLQLTYSNGWVVTVLKGAVRVTGDVTDSEPIGALSARMQRLAGAL